MLKEQKVIDFEEAARGLRKADRASPEIEFLDDVIESPLPWFGIIMLACTVVLFSCAAIVIFEMRDLWHSSDTQP